MWARHGNIRAAVSTLLLALSLALLLAALALPQMDDANYTYTPDPNLYYGLTSRPAQEGQTLVIKKDEIYWFTDASGGKQVPPPSGNLDPSNTEVIVRARNWKGETVPITYSLDLFDENGNIVVRYYTDRGAEVIVNVIHREKPNQDGGSGGGGGGGGSGGGGGGNSNDPQPPTPLFSRLKVLSQTTKGEPLSVLISYSGTLSGRQTTAFTLTYGGDMTETLTAPSTVTVNGNTYNFVKWSTSDGDYTSTSVTVSVSEGSSKTAIAVYQQQPTTVEVTLPLGTMYLPGEGIATPWLEKVLEWAWNGTWLLNVTELYRVNEHLVALLTDGSNVKVIDLANGTSIKVYLPAGWKNNKYVKAMGQVKVTQIPGDMNTLASTFPAVTVNGQTWYLVALAAWNPYKQPSGYDTSCWLANGTTLAVYNLTFTYTFKNGTRVVFKEPVVVSSLKTAVTPIYSYGGLKQGLSLKVAVKWKYLPPARTGIQPNPPSSIVGVAVIGDKVYNGTLIDANATSKTFTVTITDDTWTLYSKGVTSITASAYWLSSMGTPEGPVALQDPAQLNIVYVMLSFVYTIQRNFDESKIYVDNP